MDTSEAAFGVVDFLGTPQLIAHENGTALASEIKKQLQTQHRVNVDFGGYEFLSSAFLNHSFGQICIDLNWDAETFRQHISITNMDEDNLEELQLAIDNAQTRRVLILRGMSPDQYYSSRLPCS